VGASQFLIVLVLVLEKNEKYDFPPICHYIDFEHEYNYEAGRPLNGYESEV
jgi:hypothetical protein